MCTYCGTDNYRKIYKNHIGEIPTEMNGRSYDIHHKKIGLVKIAEYLAQDLKTTQGITVKTVNH